MSYQCKFVIKNLRDGMGHVRNWTLNSSWEWEAVPGNGQATGTLVMLLVNLSYRRLVTLLV
jgi:hypothetical protein